MNKCIFIGRLTKDVELRCCKSKPELVKATYTIAVDRRFSKDEGADFINFVAFGKLAEFASKYFKKGKRVAVESRVQINNYEKEGKKYNYVCFIVESQEFADSPSEKNVKEESDKAILDGFSEIIENKELPNELYDIVDKIY